ncbi:hypothetical protein FOA43_002796 [Brettanomyces nanus]|uniref:PUM-HD domain-containing protein n=1 Tax=Eeniella nana TaxID=13502 RepID=A0A875S121_EENNA|nr:uncharacterized protein FOA43_002796 [Brettanomyces nanus]QPG75441.1 hypothetical protein FOA43_002796 [Brettanomyces nanus]
MSDQTTLSSAEESSLNADVTTTTTPPSDLTSKEFKQSTISMSAPSSITKQPRSSHFDPSLDDIGSVLANLSLNSVGVAGPQEDSSFLSDVGPQQQQQSNWSSFSQSILPELTKTPDRRDDRRVISPFASSPFVLPDHNGKNINNNDGSAAASVSSSSLGPPLMGDSGSNAASTANSSTSNDSRRMTFPLQSPRDQNQDTITSVESPFSSAALHPAFTNDMLSIGMNYPSLNGFDAFQSPQTTPTTPSLGPVGPVRPMGAPLNSASSAQSVPSVSPPTGFGMMPPMGYQMSSQTFGQSQQQPFMVPQFRNSGSVPMFGMKRPTSVLSQPKVRGVVQGADSQVASANSNSEVDNATAIGVGSPRSLSGTANVHRKHSSSKRRGEDAARFVNASLNDFTNEIYYLCKDQHGCRFLQRQLEIGGPDAATQIFNEIRLNVIELMIDPFGNYLIQKLLERVTEEQRTTLVRNASSQFVRIALDPHGTRALQKLVECVNTQEEFDIIVNSLSSYVVLLSRDLNGNHVVQKCLQKLPPESCNFIFDAACENCVKIAKHRHGCCVLQRCFDHGTPKQCEKLSLKVGENCVELSTDPYGNYVVQYVLSMEENRLRSQNDPVSVTKTPNTKHSIDLIISALKNNLVRLSTHKFGSNVVEKSLRIPTLAPVLIGQLLKEPDSPILLLHDAYGNYVLQTTLDVADDHSFKELSELLKSAISDVRNTPHGRRILSKLISRGGASSSVGYVTTPGSTAETGLLASNDNNTPQQRYPGVLEISVSNPGSINNREAPMAGLGTFGNTRSLNGYSF